MAHTITIEIENDNDFALLKELAERLGLHTVETHSEHIPRISEQLAAFKKFTGSWQGEETADELEAIIYSGRNDKSRDLEL